MVYLTHLDCVLIVELAMINLLLSSTFQAFKSRLMYSRECAYSKMHKCNIITHACIVAAILYLATQKLNISYILPEGLRSTP